MRLFELITKYIMAVGDDIYYQPPYGTHLVHMSPKKYLSLVPKLDIDDDDRETIDELKTKIRNGEPLDALILTKPHDPRGYDGRHRAYAAMELGIADVPVYVTEKDTLRENTNDVIKQATNLVLGYYHSNSYPYEYDLEFFHDHQDELEEVGIDDFEHLNYDIHGTDYEDVYENDFKEWVASRVQSVLYQLQNWLHSSDHVYREIVTSPEWINDICRQPLGIYWSMNPNTEHQWGNSTRDSYYYKLTARIPENGIDLVQSVAQNAIDDYEYEEEIRFHAGTPLEVVKVEYRRDHTDSWKVAKLDYPVTCKT